VSLIFYTLKFNLNPLKVTLSPIPKKRKIAPLVQEIPVHRVQIPQILKKVQLWQFLKELLDDENSRVILWSNKSKGEFCMIDPEKVSAM
jgi:hypothetical protein